MDVWVVGCLVYELFTGVTPFEDGDEEVHDNILHSDPKFEGHPVLKNNKLLREFISLCLEKDPSRRADATTLLSHAWLKNNTN